jgi:hypothetical protein
MSNTAKLARSSIFTVHNASCTVYSGVWQYSSREYIFNDTPRAKEREDVVAVVTYFCVLDALTGSNYKILRHSGKVTSSFLN